jgi:hypothetical protein
MKITQRLHFGYCQGGFQQFLLEKCENRTAAALATVAYAFDT